MRTQVETIAEDTPFDQILKVIEHSKYNQFPVVNRDEKFTGLIAFQEIRDFLYDEDHSKSYHCQRPSRAAEGDGYA